MRESLFRRSALPPTFEPQPTADEVRMRARARGAAVVAVIVFDVLLVVLLHGSSQIRQGALRTFGEINIPLLLVDLFIVRVFLRARTRAYPVAQAACVVLEVTTTLIWIQMTGIVSSYFLIAAPLLIVGYRAFGGYWPTMLAAVLFTWGHFGFFLAEELGVLPHASLFVAAPGTLYASAAFRWGAIGSITGIYTLVAWGANFTASAFREKDVALSAARRDVERAIEEGQPGRLIGEALGGYVLREVIGRGGMGEVYRAERIADGREAAVKVLYRHLGAATETIARFRREVDLVKRMKARGVAEILDAGETGDGLHYLAMELLRGEDLAAFLRRRGQVPLDELLPIVDQLAEALDAAHALGIVHRDVKPQNVFLMQEPGKEGTVVKLLDFGIARLLETTAEDKVTMTLALVGTPGYMAPEQVSSAVGPIGVATDLFALGAVVYRAITGRPAFEAATLAEVLHAALHAQPAAPSALVVSLDPDVDAVIAIAIAKRPYHRYATARAFAADLRAAREGKLGEDARQRAIGLAAFSPMAVSQTMRAQVG